MNGITFDGDQTNSACAVDDDPVYAGTRSWKFNVNSNAYDDWYINFSGGLTTKSLSFWWMMEYNAAAFYMYFYNSDDEMIATIQWGYGSHLLVNKDHENSAGTIADSTVLDEGGWCYLGLTFNASDEIYIESMMASYSRWNNITDTPRYVRNNYNISWIKVVSAYGFSLDMHIDNFAYNYLLGGDGGSSGQDEGDPTDDSDYERCSYGDIGNINIYAPYHDSFITTFGDVTINAVDLFVSDHQYALVNNSKSAYVAYVNVYLLVLLITFSKILLMNIFYDGKQLILMLVLMI